MIVIVSAAELRRIADELKLARMEQGAIRAELGGLRAAAERIATALEAQPPSEGDGRTNIHVVEVQLEDPMSPARVDHMPDFTLPSTSVRAVLAVVGPKKADGSYASNGGFTTSDETTLPVEALPDSFALDSDGNPILDAEGNQIPVYRTYANTPLTPEPGEKVSGTVTWRSGGMADVDIKVVYGDPALGHAAITASEAPEA